MSRTVLVCGGRDYADYDKLNEVLDALHGVHTITLIVHGGARGADYLAGRWAGVRGIPFQVYEADWIAEGRRAGPIRNQRMLDEAKPNLVVTFLGGKGTADMIRRAEAAGIPLIKGGVQ